MLRIFLRLKLAQEASQHFLFPEPVLLVPYRQIHPGLFIYNTSLMGKTCKSILSMIASHAAFSDTAEWHLTGGEVNDGIVDAAAAKMTSGKDFLFGSRIFGEKIECKRVRMSFNLPDRIIQVRISKHRKNRSKDFFTHNRIVPGDIFQDRRCNAQGRRIGLAATDQLIGGNQILQPVKMFFIDDFSIIWILQWLFAKLTVDLFFQCLSSWSRMEVSQRI